MERTRTVQDEKRHSDSQTCRGGKQAEELLGSNQAWTWCHSMWHRWGVLRVDECIWHVERMWKHTRIKGSLWWLQKMPTNSLATSPIDRWMITLPSSIGHVTLRDLLQMSKCSSGNAAWPPRSIHSKKSFLPSSISGCRPHTMRSQAAMGYRCPSPSHVPADSQHQPPATVSDPQCRWFQAPGFKLPWLMPGVEMSCTHSAIPKMRTHK